jgi:hypothetical protein
MKPVRISYFLIHVNDVDEVVSKIPKFVDNSKPFEVAVKLRDLKWLQNDFIKFMRMV